jgi:uncharacterized protein (TIGR02145 family)
MKKFNLLIISITMFSGLLQAQYDTMYIMKSGKVIHKQSIKPEDVDSIIFYSPPPPETITVTDYDGNEYKTVQIGTQLWMAENLKSTHFSDGTPIPIVSDSAAWDALTNNDMAYSWYNDDSAAYAETYGALYTWAAAMKGEPGSSNDPSGVRGICPDGWHLPSKAEWMTLIDFLGGDSIAGGPMKEPGTEHWLAPNVGATNESGFTGLPAGYRYFDGSFTGIYYFAYWWATDEVNGSYAYRSSLGNGNAGIRLYDRRKDTGYSVRCLKDPE